jgi:hypothetical protein
MEASVLPPSGIRISCTRTIIASNTSSAFLQSQSHFRFRSLQIHRRTPTCRYASPTRKIPARFEVCRCSTNQPTWTRPTVADGPSIPRQTSALSLSILAAGFPARSLPFPLMAYAPERSTTTTSRRIWDKRQIEGFPYHESDLDSEPKVGRLRWTLRSQGGCRSCHVIAPKPTVTRLPQPGKPREIPVSEQPAAEARSESVAAQDTFQSRLRARRKEAISRHPDPRGLPQSLSLGNLQLLNSGNYQRTAN